MERFNTLSRLFLCFSDFEIEVYGEANVIECPPKFGGVLGAERNDNGFEPLILRSVVDGVYSQLVGTCSIINLCHLLDIFGKRLRSI